MNAEQYRRLIHKTLSELKESIYIEGVRDAFQNCIYEDKDISPHESWGLRMYLNEAIDEVFS